MIALNMASQIDLSLGGFSWPDLADEQAASKPEREADRPGKDVGPARFDKPLLFTR